MSTDDVVIDKTATRSPELRAYPSETDVAPPAHSTRFIRAILIGVPMALVLWAIIGLAVFRTFFEN